MTDAARIAYNAWATYLGWQDADCAVIPPWERVESGLQDAWDAAARAVIEDQLTGGAADARA